MKTLNLYAVEQGDHLIQPGEIRDLDLSSPARELLNDFRQNPPTMIDANTRAAELLGMMHHDHTRLKLVVDEQEELIGIIHLEQLNGQAFVRRVANGDHRNDITVSDLMCPRDKLRALDYQQLQDCSIADVIHALQSSGEQHCLVIERESHQIRGVLCARDIAQRLGMRFDIHTPPTFLNLFGSLPA
ncbi:histidine kinase [Zobellella taiwanensis]|jgi:CBS domain containing-hemolysin-like protein|uniref:Histidine kinase n=1 Tax=Zobellella taiwanensis TaxID=347535 RepID=A0A2P7QQ10_9GAMM|nr:CBS domain-containing protein [Zobellella taiwanensis]PSJ40046.1 histidine kinase [Zobellella taiwanensis]